MALKKNFGSHGRQYPVLACCYQVEPLTSEEAAQTSMSESHRFGTYNSRLDSYSYELNFRRSPPNGHAMLITGMYTIRNQPNLLDHSFEVKNLYGKKWGVGGKVWLTANFFDIIFIPVMKEDDLTFDFDTRLAAKMAVK
ncbi:putative papain-like cysteine peptidase superfamily [Helianthus annuus]|nr:putative papain-like cysteine peptidase superfamily [Helianthus annuus]